MTDPKTAVEALRWAAKRCRREADHIVRLLAQLPPKSGPDERYSDEASVEYEARLSTARDIESLVSAEADRLEALEAKAAELTEAECEAIDSAFAMASPSARIVRTDEDCDVLFFDARKANAMLAAHGFVITRKPTP